MIRLLHVINSLHYSKDYNNTFSHQLKNRLRDFLLKFGVLRISVTLAFGIVCKIQYTNNTENASF